MSVAASPAATDWITREQSAYFDEVRRFSQTLTNDAPRSDKAATFDRSAWDRCASFGIHGLPVPLNYGGGDADVLTTVLALEALGYGCADTGLVFSINAHMWTSVVPIWKHGTEEQRNKWLPPLCSGALIGCHAITEPDAGSDAFAMTTRATRSGDGYVLSGRKTFITNAPIADVLIIFARTSTGLGPFGISAFIVEAGTPGCSIGEHIDKLGLRTSPMAEVILDECWVPEESMLGKRGAGGEIFTTSMTWERSCIMAAQVGVIERTMEQCIDYARARRQFGKPIAKFESVADKIANMKIALDASRALVRRVGRLLDQGRDVSVEAAVAKTFVSEASVRTHLDALQIHGGYGYTTELDVERKLRDALGGTIYSGTSEIQRRIIAHGLGL